MPGTCNPSGRCDMVSRYQNPFLTIPSMGGRVMLRAQQPTTSYGAASQVTTAPQQVQASQQVPQQQNVVIPNSGGVISSVPSAPTQVAPRTTTVPGQVSISSAASGNAPKDVPTTPDSRQVYEGGDILNTGDLVGNPDWYSDIIDVARPDLAGDPEQVAYEWAKANGYGQHIEGAINRYADPYAMSLIMNSNLSTESDRLNYYGGFYDQATKATGAQGMFNPSAILQRIMTAQDSSDGGGQPLDQLGVLLYGGTNAQNPSAQVQAVMSMAKSALTGVMPPEILRNYLSVLERQGREFLATKMRDPKDESNFGQWVTAHLGSNVGF